jgi:hypothetical protein
MSLRIFVSSGEFHNLRRCLRELNVAVVFLSSSSDLRKRFAGASRLPAQDGMLWVA